MNAADKLLRKYLFRRDLMIAVRRRARKFRRRISRDIYDDQRLLFERAGISPQVIVDIGAFQGKITDQYLRAFPQVTVHALEPFPSSHRKLQERFQDEPRVHVHCLAISDESGTAQFYINNLPNTNSLLAQEGGRSKDVIDVPTLTFDAFASENGIEHIDLVKVDTEGAELKVFKGATTLLAEQRIDMVSTEVRFADKFVGQSAFVDVVNLFNEYGYTLHNVYINREDEYAQAYFGDATFWSPAFRKRLKGG